MSGQSGEAGPSGSGAPPSKAIASLAKKQSDVTRLGSSKLKFIPTIPARRVKEEGKKEEPAAPAPSASERGRGRGRGASDRGRGRGRGRGGAEGGGGPRPPAVEMTASGPFAMGPALAGTSARRTAPRSNFAPIVPGSSGHGPSGLGAGLTQTTAPSLKRENGAAPTDDAEAYSDPDEGVEIVDMENVRQMDWMAPESLRKEKDVKKKKVKKEEATKAKRKEMDMVIDPVLQEPEEEANMANAVDLSESEEEEELEDIIDDFSAAQDEFADETARRERLYFFQFPEPFPVFQSASVSDVKGKGKAEAVHDDATKKVSFAEDTKPPAETAAGTATEKEPKLDGTIGQLEVYESGAVKMRLGNGIVLDVTAATQPTFLQHAVYMDQLNKRLCVLGEVNRRFTVTPDIDELLKSVQIADEPPPIDVDGADGLIAMDTT